MSQGNRKHELLTPPHFSSQIITCLLSVQICPPSAAHHSSSHLLKDSSDLSLGPSGIILQGNNNSQLQQMYRVTFLWKLSHFLYAKCLISQFICCTSKVAIICQHHILNPMNFSKTHLEFTKGKVTKSIRKNICTGVVQSCNSYTLVHGPWKSKGLQDSAHAHGVLVCLLGMFPF